MQTTTVNRGSHESFREVFVVFDDKIICTITTLSTKHHCTFSSRQPNFDGSILHYAGWKCWQTCLLVNLILFATFWTISLKIVREFITNCTQYNRNLYLSLLRVYEIYSARLYNTVYVYFMSSLEIHVNSWVMHSPFFEEVIYS